jgi:hypothetical protein
VEARVNIDVNTARLLGTAQLLVFAASLVSERLLVSAVGTGPGAARLENVSKNLTRLRISNLVALGNCIAIIFLGVMFYFVFNEQYKLHALVALGFYLAESITLAVSKLGAYALIPLSQEFTTAGAPESSTYYQTLGNFLYENVDRRGYDLHMLFFCLGGILWYFLMYSSTVLPWVLSLWGLVAISLLTIPVLLLLYDRNLTSLMVLGLPYAPYEVVLGLWLIVRGFN